MDEFSMTMTLAAGADLSAKQYFAVKHSTSADNTCVIAAASTDDVIGILQNDPTSGQGASVCGAGRSRAKIGGTVTQGDKLGADADAMLSTRTSNGDKFCAIALQDGVDGDIIDVFVVTCSQIAA